MYIYVITLLSDRSRRDHEQDQHHPPPFVSVSLNLANVTLVARGQVVGRLCHLLECPVETVQVHAELFRQLFAFVRVVVVLRLDARVVLVRDLALRVADRAACRRIRRRHRNCARPPDVTFHVLGSRRLVGLCCGHWDSSGDSSSNDSNSGCDWR